MDRIENNEATEYVYGAYFGFDFDTEVLPQLEDMEAMDSVSTFSEYVYLHAVRCGYAGDGSNSKELAVFVAKKCDDAGVVLGSGTKATIERWLKKGLPANTADGRDNVYKLCFALKMDAQQTVEFFLKAYLERPFNYKDIHEAVYFFCLNNGKNYSDAQRIISAIESEQVKENPYADNITEQIGMRIQEFATEDELLRYIAENRSGFIIQNQTATGRINQLVESCKAIAPKEYAISCNDDKEISVSNIDELLNVIYGYSARATIDAKPVYKKSISKSNFPDLMKRNWPQREQFAQILEKKTASYDVIRRALIMLTFYDFAANATVSDALEYGIFDEFTDEMNTVLAECGYVQLYWRNPFDWMIGYCAMSLNPLGTLRNLIEEYYLSDSTVCDQPKELSENEIFNQLMHNW